MGSLGQTDQDGDVPGHERSVHPPLAGQVPLEVQPVRPVHLHGARGHVESRADALCGGLGLREAGLHAGQTAAGHWSSSGFLRVLQQGGMVMVCVEPQGYFRRRRRRPAAAFVLED